MNSPSINEISAFANTIRFEIDDVLREEAEAVKAGLISALEASGENNTRLIAEREELLILRGQLIGESNVPSGSTLLTHDQAVQIAAARIRVDSINARLSEIDEISNHPAALNLVRAQGCIRQLCALWREQMSDAVDRLLAPFDPRSGHRSSCVNVLAGADILQRIGSGSLFMFQNEGTARRVIDILDRFLEGRPYLGDDSEPEGSGVEEQGSTT